MPRIVLLFLHGGSFTKECLRPIIQRLRRSTLLQQVPCEVAWFDWRFHGEKSDHTVESKLFHLNGDPKKPRYDHPLRVWPEWASDDIEYQVNKLRAEDPDTHIIGIGHSMGGSAMLRVEMQHPGTFDAIIAFEPVNDDGMTPDGLYDSFQDVIIDMTANRPGEWDSWEAVLDHFKKGKMYRHWHPECLAAFLEQGVRQTSDGRYLLATAPTQEAAIYTHDLVPFDFTPIKAKAHFLHGTNSYFFNAHAIREEAAKFPDKVSVGDEILNTTHAMVMEDPDTCTQRILSFLEQHPLFKPKSKL